MKGFLVIYVVELQFIAACVRLLSGRIGIYVITMHYFLS